VFSEQREVDAAATAGHCNEGHAGAALWAVAAALVKLHGGVALSALLQAQDTEVCSRPEDMDHADSVRWRLYSILGEELPQDPAPGSGGGGGQRRASCWGGQCVARRKGLQRHPYLQMQGWPTQEVNVPGWLACGAPTGLVVG